jgi:hypothetical protein
MDQLVRYTIRFPDMEIADAGRAAESLRRTLQDVSPGLAATRVRTDANLMDFGAALELALAAPAIVEVAKGIASWLARAHSSKLTIAGPDGSTIVEGITSRDAASLAEKLQAAHASHT